MMYVVVRTLTCSETKNHRREFAATQEQVAELLELYDQYSKLARKWCLPTNLKLKVLKA
jgi:hypothetical protein